MWLVSVGLLFFFSFFVNFLVVFAQTGPGGESSLGSLRLCTQNAHRYGEKKGRPLVDQTTYLAQRTVNARCDILALQEVFGESKSESWKNVNKLKKKLESVFDKQVAVFLGETNDRHIRNAFLLIGNVGRVIDFKSIHRELLPKLQPLGPNQRHLRDPLLLALETRLHSASRGQQKKITLLMLTFHLKSKAKGYLDPMQLEYEGVRVESASNLLELLNHEQAKYGDSAVSILLGDRNSPVESASNDVLKGKVLFQNFLQRGGCRVDDHLKANCPPGLSNVSGDYLDLLAWRNSLSKDSQLYTYKYKEDYSVLDDILVSRQDKHLFLGPDGPRAGVAGKFQQGSDHLMVWAEMRLSID